MVLSNSDYEAVTRGYDDRRAAGNRLLHERLSEVYEKIPRFREIEDEITSFSAAFSKKAIFMDEAEYKKLYSDFKAKISRLSDEKRKLLQVNGFKPDYLEKVYSCSLCKDTGFVNEKKCICFGNEVSKLIGSRNIDIMPPANARLSLFRTDYYSNDDIDPDTGLSSRTVASEALAYCKDFISNFNEFDKKNILMYGNTGVGKTFLSGCMANELADVGYSTAFLTAYNFFKILEKESFKSGGREENTVTALNVNSDYLFTCDFLVLDDIGTEVINTFTSTKLYECINERILKNKATVITTNLSLFHIKNSYSERIFSRIISNYRLIKLTGNDIRQIKGKPDLA